jgi:hypothetical protein
MTNSNHFDSIPPNHGHPTMKTLRRRLLGKQPQAQVQQMPVRAGIPAIPRKTVALALMAVLVLASSPTTMLAGFVGPSMIQIDGNFADWTNNVYSITNKTPLQYSHASDLDAFWMAMSTANGTSPASSANRIQNVYYRLDVGADPTGGGGQAYWIQMNLGVAPPGFADHILQVYANHSGTPAISLSLFQFITNSTTPYPAVAVFTVKSAQVTLKVSNDSSLSPPTTDANATAAFAAYGSGYSIEMKLPIGWFTNTSYGGPIKDDGTGPAVVENAVFSATGSKGAVGTPQDKIVDASGNEYHAQQSTTTGSTTFTVNNASGYAFSLGAAAATLTPVAGASDNITLTVNQNNGGTIVTDTTYTGAHNVTISGFTASPNGSHGTLNGTPLAGSSVTISVTFASGVATIPLILDNAALQNIQFSISGLTVPQANVLDTTPTVATVSAAQSTLTPTSASITANGSSTQVLTVQAKDAYGNNLTTGGSTVTITKQSGTGTIGSVTSVGNGTYTAMVTSPTATGSGVFVATLGGAAVNSGTGSQTQATVSYAPGPATHLAFTTQPSASTVAGVAFAQQPVVKVEDQYGNVVTSGSDSTVNVALTLTTGAGTLGGTASMAAVNGVADFSGKGLNLSKVGVNKVLTATATLSSPGVVTATTSPAFTITLPPVGYLRGPGAGIKIHVSNLLTADSAWDDYTLTYVSCGSTTVNGVSLAISGSGSNTLIVYPSSAANSADSFQYTISDSHGDTWTGTVNLTLNLTLSGQQATISVSGAVATMTFLGVPSYHYAVQRATDLSGQGNWADITVTSSNASIDDSLGYSVLTAPTGGAFAATDHSAPGSSAYYRLRATP